MRILLTNDDGIDAAGLVALEKIARNFAGNQADIWVVAPKTEQSGVGHAISLLRGINIQQIDSKRFSVDGYPADCVICAMDLMDGPPDLILSGVNRGNNSAENVVYSGTIGAAMEGAFQDCPAIALSQFIQSNTSSQGNIFDAAEQHGAAVISQIMNYNQWQDRDYRLFYNINFPPCSGKDVLGVKALRQGLRPAHCFRTKDHPNEFHNDPHADQNPSPGTGHTVYLHGGPQHAASGPNTDATLNLDGWISVTPLTADLTAHRFLDSLTEHLA